MASRKLALCEGSFLHDYAHSDTLRKYACISATVYIAHLSGFRPAACGLAVLTGCSHRFARFRGLC